MYVKLLNFIQLSLTLTKFFRIKCDHLVAFTFHLKNAKNCDVSAPV